jgi:hypothetical protein
VSLNVPGILNGLDPSFFLVPELDLAKLSSRKSGIKVDLLTTASTPRDEGPRMVAPLGLAAQPLRYMDYLPCPRVSRPRSVTIPAISQGPVVVSFPRTPPAARPTRHGALPRR